MRDCRNCKFYTSEAGMYDGRDYCNLGFSVKRNLDQPCQFIHKDDTEGYKQWLTKSTIQEAILDLNKVLRKLEKMLKSIWIKND